MKKQIIKSVLAVVMGISFLLLADALFSVYEMEWKKTVITELKNEETGCSVVLQEIGSPFSFGPSMVQVILKNEKGNILDEAEDRIYNDGKNLYAGNISVVWTDTGVDVTLHGEEQEDRVLKLQYQE